MRFPLSRKRPCNTLSLRTSQWIISHDSTIVNRLLGCFLDVALTYLTAPSFASRARPRRGTAASRKFQEKVYKYERAVRSKPRSVGLRPDFVPLRWKMCGFFHPRSHSLLGNMSHRAPLIRDDLLKGLSWTLWRTTDSLFDRASHRLAWLAAGTDPIRSSSILNRFARHQERGH